LGLEQGAMLFQQERVLVLQVFQGSYRFTVLLE
jgi:hypothetical protein